MKANLIIVAIFLLCSNISIAQADNDSIQDNKVDECPQKDLADLFRKKDKKPKPPKNFNALVVPNISSNPNNGLLLGIGGSISWYLGDKETTRVSNAGFTAAVTTKQQLITFIKPNIYTNNDDFFIQGDLRYYIYSQGTYGLGSNAPESSDVPTSYRWEGYGGPDDSVSFDMKFNYLKLHGIVNRKIIPNLYAGLGYHMDYYSSIVDEDLNLDTVPAKLTPHFYYSQQYDFNTNDYMLSGLSVNVVYDSRDNQINPYKGFYANLNYRYNFEGLGSDQNASNLWAEFRTYVGLSKKTPRHLVGFWLFGSFNLTGNMPYLTLPAIGEDQRARSGRGYTNGRFRGKDLVYGEVEWRFPIIPCSKIMGGVIFVNATTTDYPDKDVGLFEYIQPAVGFGLRFMINKYFRTNLNIDIAITQNGSGFYFSGAETF